MVAELANGALHLQPRPALRHASACFSIAGRLDDPFRHGVGGPGGWHFAIEPELHLGADVLVADLCGWRRERLPVYPDTAAIDLAPDWVCELLSPGTRRFDMTEKRDLYGLSGVRHLWFVDPQAETLEVFARREDAWMLAATFQGGDEARIVPFEVIAFRLATLWPA